MSRNSYIPQRARIPSGLDGLLPVSEVFYSLQGEGRWGGCPAAFVRLAFCNLGCVWCDTTFAWEAGQMRSYQLWTPEETAAQVFRCIPARVLRENPPHIVLTGGEPLLHQDKLAPLISHLKIQGLTFIEVETNGSLEPSRELLSIVSWWNCSPKLRNSELPASERVNPAALALIAESGQADFKFVVANEADLRDMERTYLPLLPRDRIWLMPKLKSRFNSSKRLEQLARLGLMRGYRLTPRLQILIWDQESER